MLYSKLKENRFIDRLFTDSENIREEEDASYRLPIKCTKLIVELVERNSLEHQVDPANKEHYLQLLQQRTGLPFTETEQYFDRQAYGQSTMHQMLRHEFRALKQW